MKKQQSNLLSPIKKLILKHRMPKTPSEILIKDQMQEEEKAEEILSAIRERLDKAEDAVLISISKKEKDVLLRLKVLSKVTQEMGYIIKEIKTSIKHPKKLAQLKKQYHDLTHRLFNGLNHVINELKQERQKLLIARATVLIELKNTAKHKHLKKIEEKFDKHVERLLSLGHKKEDQVLQPRIDKVKSLMKEFDEITSWETLANTTELSDMAKEIKTINSDIEDLQKALELVKHKFTTKPNRETPEVIHELHQELRKVVIDVKTRIKDINLEQSSAKAKIAIDKKAEALSTRIKEIVWDLASIK